MEVVTAHESKETDSGCYHLLNDANTASLCGSINDESQFAADISEVLARKEAEERGFYPCRLCSFIADPQRGAKPELSE